MSRRHSEDSSLELLLDTMCNTFGGVMFIAILLSVMVSIRGQKQSEPVPDQTEKIAEAKAQISRLQTELSLMMKSTQEQALQLERMKLDPRLRLVHEIALMERMHKEKQVRLKMTEQKVNLNRSALKNLQIQTLKLDDEKQKTTKILDEQLALKKKKEQKLKDLVKQIGSLNLKNMNFMTMTKKDSIPYFLFVNNGRVWAVGPEIRGTSYTPNPAVRYQVKNQRFICTPVPGKGVPVFSGQDISADLQQLLSNLPSGRVPEFVISKSDAADFYRLRDILKKQKIFHGFMLQKDDQSYFDYQFVNQKGSYVY